MTCLGTAAFLELALLIQFRSKALVRRAKTLKTTSAPSGNIASDSAFPTSDYFPNQDYYFICNCSTIFSITNPADPYGLYMEMRLWKSLIGFLYRWNIWAERVFDWHIATLVQLNCLFFFSSTTNVQRKTTLRSQALRVYHVRGKILIVISAMDLFY